MKLSITLYHIIQTMREAHLSSKTIFMSVANYLRSKFTSAI